MAFQAAYLVLPTLWPFVLSHSIAATIATSLPFHRYAAASLFFLLLHMLFQSGEALPFTLFPVQFLFFLCSSTQHHWATRPHLDSRPDHISQVYILIAFHSPHAILNSMRARAVPVLLAVDNSTPGALCSHRIKLAEGKGWMNTHTVTQGADSGCCPLCVLVWSPYPHWASVTSSVT